jgi:hypothetical protein
MDADRQASILTPTFRRVLNPDNPETVDPETSRGRSTKHRIRERVREAFHDFRVLPDFFDRDERQIVFGPVYKDGELVWDEELRQSAIHVIAFLYLCYSETATGPSDEFEHIVEQGVVKALRSEYLQYTVSSVAADVEIELERSDLSVAKQKYDQGDALTQGELRELLDHGELPDEVELRDPSDSQEDC